MKNLIFQAMELHGFATAAQLTNSQRSALIANGLFADLSAINAASDREIESALALLPANGGGSSDGYLSLLKGGTVKVTGVGLVNDKSLGELELYLTAKYSGEFREFERNGRNGKEMVCKLRFTDPVFEPVNENDPAKKAKIERLQNRLKKAKIESNANENVSPDHGGKVLPTGGTARIRFTQSEILNEQTGRTALVPFYAIEEVL